MSIPTSGTYRMTIALLTKYGNAFDSNPRKVRYGLSTTGNEVYGNVAVTFSGNTLSWRDSSGVVHTMSYNTTASTISGLNNGSYSSNDSVILKNTSDYGNSVNNYFILSTEDPSQFRAGVYIDHNVNDARYWYRGNLIYRGGDSTSGAFTNLTSVDSEVCFLRGTLIKTPRSEVAVETLCAGDELLTYSEHSKPQVAIVTRIYKAQTFVRQNLSDDEAGYPVRVLKDSIADGVPFKDLLVTPEHCLFFDGMFIPARMLVNGSSIFYDTSFTSYEYFHIETEKHSVITADGMLTESYLDTGNRHVFLQEESVFHLGHQKQNAKTWEKDAAATLTTARNVVEPIFRQIEARAQDMQRTVVTQPTSLTDDADIHLVTNKGQIIRPSRQNGNTLIFQLSEQTRSVQIMSNASRPYDVVGSFLDDRRKLGVLIGDIKIFSANKTISLTNHLQEEGLSGWHTIESPSMRWTNGNAELPLTEDSLSAKSILSLQIISAGPYLVSEDLENTKAA